MEACGSAEISAPATATQSASSDEADSPDSILVSLTGVPAPLADQPNRWCVDGQYQVYSDAKFLNDKGVMTRTLTLDSWVHTGILPTMPDIHNLFTRYRPEWTARFLGRYSEELVQEFYASYVATLRSRIDKRASPAKQALHEHIRVRGIQVDISLQAIRQYLYDEDVDTTRTPLTAEFHYRCQIVKDVQFLHEP